MDFERFTSDITENKWNVHGVEVYRSGELIHSFGDTTEGIYDIYSATKSVLSVAFGICYDRGLIDLDECILTYLPKARVDALSPDQRSVFGKITVRRLLTMSVIGFPFRAEEPDYLDFSLNLKTLCVDEPSFNYSNIPPYLICAALDNVLGEDLGGFIEENILKPLGIDKYEYGRSPEGIFYGSSKMKLTVNGLSRIGLLMMNNGMFEGRRIISEEYVRMATSKQMNNREGGYGYYFWIYRDGFSINGKLKQKCYCLPSGGLMVTYLAHIEDDLPDLKESMERNILDI